jgi:hypothetical protein
MTVHEPMFDDLEARRPWSPEHPVVLGCFSRAEVVRGLWPLAGRTLSTKPAPRSLPMEDIPPRCRCT